jgi:hypothetical protein
VPNEEQTACERGQNRGACKDDTGNKQTPRRDRFGPPGEALPPPVPASIGGHCQPVLPHRPKQAISPSTTTLTAGSIKGCRTPFSAASLRVSRLGKTPLQCHQLAGSYLPCTETLTHVRKCPCPPSPICTQKLTLEPRSQILPNSSGRVTRTGPDCETSAAWFAPVPPAPRRTH